MLKRALSLVLLLVTVLSFAACNGGGEAVDPTASTTDSQGVVSSVGCSGSVSDTDSVTDNTTDETTDTSTVKRPTNPTVDYPLTYGRDFVFLLQGDPESPFGVSAKDPRSKDVAERIEEVRKAYFCTFELQQVPDAGPDFLANMQARQFASNSGDLLFADVPSIRSIIGVGGDSSLLVDLTYADDELNFWNTGKWGSIAARSSMMAGGRFYGLIPNLWPTHSAVTSDVLVYNRQVLSAFNVPDPLEYWENNAWDREVMLRSFTSVLNEEKEVYGICSSSERMVRATVLASGVPFAKIDRLNQDETVEWSFGVTSAQTVEALEWLQNSMKTHAKYFNCGKTDVTFDRADALANGNAAFSLLSFPTILSQVATNMEDFGMVLWAGKKANTYYESHEDTLFGVAIPVFTQDAALSACLIYDLFKGFDDVNDREDLLTYYRNTYFGKNSGVEILFLTRGTKTHYYPMAGGDVILDEICTGLLEAESVETLVKNAAEHQKELFELHDLSNLAALDRYRQSGYFE